MKHFLLVISIITSATALCQIPNGYYDNAQNLNGSALQEALYNIVHDHTQLTYTPGLWTAFATTDVYPNGSPHTGKIWDIYSTKNDGTADYFYTLFDDQCGNYSGENNCYNREHSWPKSYFNDQYPMYSDLFHIYPTDGYVNNKRDNFPYGEVSTANYTSSNGSKLGPSAISIPNYTGVVFEPIDSFKGDLARSYFYMSTAYFNDDDEWDDWAMANRAVLKPWAIEMLLSWSHLDPVSEKEINRNNAIYNIQGNRNPFIDHPEFIDCIWGNGNCVYDSNSTNLPDYNLHNAISVYPNPTTDYIYVDWHKMKLGLSASSLQLFDINGKLLYNASGFQNGKTHEVVDLQHYSRGIYILILKSQAEISITKIVKI